MKDAITKAIEGGYEPRGLEVIQCTTLHDEYYDHYFLDPLFWQALGKAMGWEKRNSSDLFPEWHLQWRNFIDHLASGKDVESFFKELLK